MDSQKQIAQLLVTHEGKSLLVRNHDHVTTNPGHWIAPWIELNDAPPVADPNYCGLQTNLASATQRTIEALGVSHKFVNSVRHAQTVNSPPWHPRREVVHIVTVDLSMECETKATDFYEGSVWVSADEADSQWESGTFLLNALTRSLIKGERPIWDQWPGETPLPDLEILAVRSHTLPPASHTNAFLIGDCEPTLVDPSPANEAAYQKLLQRLEARPPARIFLTHHHPDHHQQVPRLAKELGLPVHASADTINRIGQRFGSRYWEGIELRTVGNEDKIGTWRDREVKAYAVPGHDAGHLALAPDDMSWMIVGDLIQGIGTVVIAEPEGDMAAYFGSLRWVIEQNPKVIIPSHGQAMGSCFRIEETLRHRLQREDDVFAMHLAGLGIEEILEQLYANVDRRLWGLARMNIQSHLKKLKNEGRIRS